MVVEVGRVEHGEDMVERIRLIGGRQNIGKGDQRGRGREGCVATSMLEKHREALRAKYHSSRGILLWAAEARNCRSTERNRWKEVPSLVYTRAT